MKQLKNKLRQTFFAISDRSQVKHFISESKPSMTLSNIHPSVLNVVNFHFYVFFRISLSRKKNKIKKYYFHIFMRKINFWNGVKLFLDFSTVDKILKFCCVSKKLFFDFKAIRSCICNSIETAYQGVHSVSNECQKTFSLHFPRNQLTLKNSESKIQWNCSPCDF